MSRKTRKLIWVVPLLAIFAVAGALAIFAAQPADPAEAHGPPGPVTGISATASGYDTINLSWNMPDSGGDVAGYRIDYSADSYAWKALVADTGDTKTTYKDAGLKPNTTRYYRVFAMNSAGSGPVSTDESYAFTTTTGVQAPGPVRNLVATSGPGKIDLSWTAPADNGGAKIARYCIAAAEIGSALPILDDAPADCTTEGASFSDPPMGFAYTDVGIAGTWMVEIVTEKAVTKYEHKYIDASNNVAGGQQWAFQVYAANREGTTLKMSDTASNRATATVGKASAVQKPAAPMNLKAVQEAAGGTPDVRLYWNEAKDVAMDDRTTTISYQLNVSVYDTATNKWGAFAVDGTAITITPNSHTEVYQGSHSPVANDEGTAKVRYQVRYAAVPGGAPASGWSNTAEVKLLDLDINDEAFVLPKLTSVTEANRRLSYNTIHLTWEREENDGVDDVNDVDDVDPSRPTGYVIDFRDASKMETNEQVYSSWKRLQHNTGYSRTYYYHRGLEQGSKIEYRIFPWHQHSYGAPAQVAPHAETKSAVTPDPVRGLTVMADGPDKLKLTWPTVTNNGGSPITGYRIEVAISDTSTDWPGPTEKADNDASDAPAIDSGVVKSVDANTTTYTYTDDDLIAGSTRWFRVFALNVQNDEDDETGSVTTAGLTDSDVGSAEAKEGTTARGPNPMAPEDLTSELAKTSSLYTFGQTGVLLLWNMAKESRSYDPVANYEIQRMVNDGDWEDLVTTTNTDTFHTDEDLPETGEMRAYRVRSVTASDKVSPWSNVTYFPGMHGMDTAHFMATGTLPAQTVDVDAMVTVDASAGFTGDMLTYSVMSSDDAVAMATVDEMSGMVTITGVAAGMATITVTATDAAGAYAMQTIMVTVEAADVTLGVPGGVMTSDATENPGTLLVKVDWTPGDNAVGHLVMLFTDDWQGAPMVEGMPTGNSHTFTVDAGSYIAVVVAYDADANIELAISGVTSVGGS